MSDPTTKLTPRQRQVLRAIHDHLLREQRAITVRALAKALGLRANFFVIQLLDALARKGFLTSTNGVRDGVRICGLVLEARYEGEEGLRLQEALREDEGEED